MAYASRHDSVGKRGLDVEAVWQTLETDCRRTGAASEAAGISRLSSDGRYWQRVVFVVSEDGVESNWRSWPFLAR